MVPGRAEIKNDDGAWMLRDAIILSMCKNYKHNYKRKVVYEDTHEVEEVASIKDVKNDEYRRILVDLEISAKQFFTNWYQVLTDLDGGYILKGLRKEVERKYEEEKKEMAKGKGEVAKVARSRSGCKSDADAGKSRVQDPGCADS